MATNVTDLDVSSSSSSDPSDISSLVSDISSDPLDISSDSSDISSLNLFSKNWENLPSDVHEIFQASEAGEVETLKSLFNNSSNSSQLLLQVDGEDCTALHWAVNRDTAKVLVESVEPNKLREFLWKPDFADIQFTALDDAVHFNKVDVVEYLCGLTSADESLLDGHLLPGHRSLHLANSVHVARILVESVPSDKKTDLLLHTINGQQTALHAASMFGHSEVVEYLCGLCASPLSSAVGLLYSQDVWGKTPLHVASTGEVARLLNATVQDSFLFIDLPDYDGNTPVMSMVKMGHVDSLRYALQHISSEFGFWAIECAVLKKNNYKQNILHLACISPLVEDFYDVLEEYLDCVKVEDLFTADIFNNTPFTYLVAGYSTRLFAHFILKFPLWQRRKLLLLKNQMQTNCRTISMQESFCAQFYEQNVLCNGQGGIPVSDDAILGAFLITGRHTVMNFLIKTSPMYVEDLFKVMKYALNEYSLLDQPMVSTQSHVLALTSPVQRHGHEHTVEMAESSVAAQSTLEISYFDADELALEDIQRELYTLDVVDRHSEPKVVVVRCSTSDLVRYVSPPGPDFIIITLVCVHSVSDMQESNNAAVTQEEDLAHSVEANDKTNAVAATQSLERGDHSCDAVTDVGDISTPTLVLEDENSDRLRLPACWSETDWQKKVITYPWLKLNGRDFLP